MHDWSIEISDDASQAEIDAALLVSVDFDHIRECVAVLREIVQEYGTFEEIEERTDDSNSEGIYRSYHEKRGWVCDELKLKDSYTVWTKFFYKGFYWLSHGFYSDVTSTHHIISWFIIEKSTDNFDQRYPHIEFNIPVYDESDPDYPVYEFSLHLWDLLAENDLSDHAILGHLCW